MNKPDPSFISSSAIKAAGDPAAVERGQSAVSVGARSRGRSSQYTASRLEMMQMGVPEDYIDALLDEGYMERLIVANDHLNKKRRLRLQRYLGMNKIILVFLVLQSLLGIFVALYKTVFQPDVLFSAEARLQDVDLVLMMDASKHNQRIMGVQHQSIRNFTGELNRTLKGHRVDQQVHMQQNLTEMQGKEESIFVKYLPFLKYLTSGASAEAHVFGGWLRVSTGTFNARDTTALHGFANDLAVQDKALSDMQPSKYTSHAQLYTAMQHCEGMLKNHGNPNARRYCVIIGDNEAMCRKDVGTAVDKMLNKWGSMRPSGFNEIGNLLEYEHEMEQCTQFAEKDLKAQNAEVIMMFTVGSQKEEQLRLGNPAFQKFVRGATGCEILFRQENASNKRHYYHDEDSCLRFIMARGFDDLAAKSKKVTELLKRKESFDEEPNKYKDQRYLFFLILPLNLVFYVVWSKILRCTMHVKKTANRAMGVKKKMIKVSKTLVEKERRDSTAEQLEASLTEVELAEVSSLRPVIACGVPMTLRARLKGGYVRKNADKDVCDGHGQAFSEDAFWNFEPIDLSGVMIRNSALQGGQRVRIRNHTGQILRVTSEQTGFVDDKERAGGLPFGLAPTMESPDDGNGSPGEDTEFMVEQLDTEPGEEESSNFRLGDTIRIKSCATGKYIRIHKDGRCDGLGESVDTECQFNIDLGGSTISTSAVVTLKSTRTACYMYADANCILSAMPGGEPWRYWMLEKKEGLSTVDETEGDGGDAEGKDPADAARPSMAASDTQRIGTLKVGDIVTLKGMNQNYLEVLDDRTVRCGQAAEPKEEGSEAVADLDAVAAQQSTRSEAAVTGCTEFVIQRMGMGLVKKHDNTIRTGAEVCLRPLRAPAGDSSGDGDSSRYLSVRSDGDIVSEGRISSRDIGFVLEMATVQEMVAPVQTNLMKGDVELMISPLWNKNEVKRLEALSAPWTQAGEMSSFRGAVVVANDNGQYTVPKAKGESFQGWVAVVKDGVDIKKAAKQAKAQGATGIIVRSTEVLSLEKLSRNIGQDPPELPAVFMDATVADALNERGINLKGCEFKGRTRTQALRSIGRAGAARDSGDMGKVRSSKVAADVFKAVGSLMVEEHEEKANQPEQEDGAEDDMEDVEVSDGGAGKGFQWKVAANTHYLWSTSAGGATRMNVNFGAKAPPSAKKKVKVDTSGREVHETDASQNHVRRSLTKIVRRPKPAREGSFNREKRGSLLGVTMIESSDLVQHRLAGELDELDFITPGQAAENLEQLPDDSDFKIEYHFEEVEVAVGEKAEELAEEELIDDSGAVVGRFAVPVGRFWLVAFGMLFSTVLLSMLLYFLVKTAEVDTGKNLQGSKTYDPSFDSPNNFAARASGIVDLARRLLRA